MIDPTDGLIVWVGSLPPGTRVDLISMRKSGGINQVAAIEDWESAPELVRRAVEAAQDDADAWGGVCRFYLAHHGEPAMRSFAFRLRGSRALDDAPPDVASINKALMSYCESLQKQLVTLSRQTAESEHATVVQLRKQLERRDKLYLRQLELLEDLTSAQHERDLARQRSEQRAAVVERAGKQLVAYLPRVAARVLGPSGKLDPASAPAYQQLKAFAENLTPEQVQGLAGVLGDRAGELFDILAAFEPEEDHGTDEPEPESGNGVARAFGGH